MHAAQWPDDPGTVAHLLLVRTRYALLVFVHRHGGSVLCETFMVFGLGAYRGVFVSPPLKLSESVFVIENTCSIDSFVRSGFQPQDLICVEVHNGVIFVCSKVHQYICSATMSALRRISLMCRLSTSTVVHSWVQVFSL